MKKYFLLLLFALFAMGCDDQNSSGGNSNKNHPEGQMDIPLSENAGVAVDLGLSVLWSDRYLGAESPEDRGKYYAWGEIEPKEFYGWDTWKFDGYDWSDIPSDIEGTEHDAARMNWGGKWRLPTMEEVRELEAKCTLSGNGLVCVATGTNGNSIQFVLTSFYFDNDFYRPIEDTPLWSGSLSRYWGLSWSDSGKRWYCDSNNANARPVNGYCIRPVMDK